MREMRMGLGRRLRHMRQARGLTLKELAEETGFTPGYLSQIEKRARRAGA